MGRCLLLLVAVAAGVSCLATREAAAHPVSLLEAERWGLPAFPSSSEKLTFEAASASKPLEDDSDGSNSVDSASDGRDVGDSRHDGNGDGNSPVPGGLVALEGGTMQPSGGGSGGGAVSPSGLLSATSFLVTAPSVVGQVVESRLLIPIRFLDGVFRPPRLS